MIDEREKCRCCGRSRSYRCLRSYGRVKQGVAGGRESIVVCADGDACVAYGRAWINGK